MPTEKSQDQRGAERPGREDREEKPVHPPADVPGVRGPIRSAGEREDAPPGTVESWGSEGGAGCYAGGPHVSDTKIPPGRSGRKPAWRLRSMRDGGAVRAWGRGYRAPGL